MSAFKSFGKRIKDKVKLRRESKLEAPNIISHETYKKDETRLTVSDRGVVKGPAANFDEVKREANQYRTTSNAGMVQKRPVSKRDSLLQSSEMADARARQSMAPLGSSQRLGDSKFAKQPVGQQPPPRASRPSMLSSRLGVEQNAVVEQLLNERDSSSDESEGMPVAQLLGGGADGVVETASMDQFDQLAALHRRTNVVVKEKPARQVTLEDMDGHGGDTNEERKAGNDDAGDGFDVTFEVDRSNRQPRATIRKSGGAKEPQEPPQRHVTWHDEEDFGFEFGKSILGSVRGGESLTNQEGFFPDPRIQDSQMRSQTLANDDYFSRVRPRHAASVIDRESFRKADDPPQREAKAPPIQHAASLPAEDPFAALAQNRNSGVSIRPPSTSLNVGNKEHAEAIRQSLLEHNLGDVQPNRVSLNTQTKIKQQEMEKIQEEAQEQLLESRDRLTKLEDLKQAPAPAYRKRTTFAPPFLDDLDESVDDHRIRMDSGRNAIVKKRPSTDQKMEEEEAAESEKSYDSESNISLTEIEKEEEAERKRKEDPEEVQSEELESDEDLHFSDTRTHAGVGRGFLDDLINENAREVKQQMEQEENSHDIIHLIDESEHLFIRYAQQKLVDNKQLLDERAKKLQAEHKKREFVEQRVLTNLQPRPYGQFDTQLHNLQPNETHTAITLSDEVAVLGTNRGKMFAYNREDCRLYARFHDDDFDKSSVTCMHIHPLRTEYLVAGYDRGQFCLIDLSIVDKNKRLKTKKVVKDHHKGVPIINIKFCDWIKEKEVTEEAKGSPNTQDIQAWMIVSIDVEGKVVVTSITSMTFGILRAKEFVIFDPRTMPDGMTDNQKYCMLSPRFYAKIFPQGEYNDSQTWVTLANKQEVQIVQLTRETCTSCFSMRKPSYYPSERTGAFEPFPDVKPILAWGFGRSPCFKHRTYSMLAIAWGAMIQLVLLVPDDERHTPNEFFRVDGVYFIAPGAVQDMVPGTNIIQDVRIEYMHFLSESVLLVYTSTHDVKVLYTQSFFNGPYENPTDEQLKLKPPLKTTFDAMDSRLKLMEAASALSKEQRNIEMERRKFLRTPLLPSSYGAKASQTISTYEDMAVFMTEGGIISVQHLTWQEYVEASGQENQSTWIETFKKTLDIFDGKIKGFKGVVDDRDLRQEGMKAQLKLLVTDHIDKVIGQWKTQADKQIASGKAETSVYEDLQEKYRTLIKRSIELCVEIWEPFFLFWDLFQKFADQNMPALFAEEMKPYILSGTFADTEMPESILVHHILKHPFDSFNQQESNREIVTGSPSSGCLDTNTSPAESFEKIIVNLSFNSCSEDYRYKLLNFCKDKRLTTGHFYLSVNYAGEEGIKVALHQMRVFFLTSKEQEKYSSHGLRIVKPNDLLELSVMAADVPQREQFEKSSVYLGYKMLWAIRLTLLGKKFPKGHYNTKTWQQLVHEVLDIITQVDFMKTLLEIDASAFFQIVTIAFNNPSVQYDFLEKGRPQPVNLMQEQKVSMSHAEVVRRISDYCLMELEQGDPVRLAYLFFVASIADGDYEMKDQLHYYKVTIELLSHAHEFMAFNRTLLSRQMTMKQMYRKLSRKGFEAPDSIKHVVLSEESIMKLILKCEPLSKDQVNQLVECIKDTDFDSLKLMLYEKQEAYTKCLKLLVERESVSTFVTVKMRDRFAWIIQTYFMLESRLVNRSENTHNRYQLDQFEQQIFTYANVLARIDPHKAVGLISCLFKDSVEQHLNFIKKMTDHSADQYLYVTKLLDIKNDEAKQIMTEYTLTSKDPAMAKLWLQILNTELELTCQNEPDRVVEKVKRNLKQNFYPAEECLKVCHKHQMKEACAILCKKIGRYKESVQFYIESCSEGIDIAALKKELHGLDRLIRVTLLKQKKQLAEKQLEAMKQMSQNANDLSLQLDVGNYKQLTMDIDHVLQQSRGQLMPGAFREALTKNEIFGENLVIGMYKKTCPNIERLENTVRILLKLIRSHPDEVMRGKDDIWITIILYMFGLSSHPEMHRKRYCRRYIIVKTVELVREMLKHLNLKAIINGILGVKEHIRFRTVRQLIAEVFMDKKVEVDLCTTASSISTKELKEHSQTWFTERADGSVFRYTRCDICGLNVTKTSLQMISSVSRSVRTQGRTNLVIFDCSRVGNRFNHVYHESCVYKFIKEELSKDKKAKLKDCDVIKAYRCIRCFQQSQDIRDMCEQRPARNAPGKRNASRQQATEGSSETDSLQEAIANGHRSVVTTFQNPNRLSLKDMVQERMLKKLADFERDMQFDILKSESF